MIDSLSKDILSHRYQTSMTQTTNETYERWAHEVEQLEAALKESERISKSWKAQWTALLEESQALKKALYEREEWLGKRVCQYAACPEYARLKEGLEDVITHQKLVTPSGLVMSSTARIAAKALEETK